MSNPVHLTLFQEEANKYQATQYRTKGQGVKADGKVLLFGIRGLILFAGVAVLAKTVSIPLLAISVLAIVLGFVFTAKSASGASKTVTCPKCKSKHALNKNVRKFMCPTCRTLLLMGSEPAPEPQFVACSYCGLETAVTTGHGNFLCPDCGILRQPDPSAKWQPGAKCLKCNTHNPAHAMVCMSCGAVQAPDLSSPEPGLKYDMDWKIGKSARGHAILATSYLMMTRDLHTSSEKTDSTLNQLKYSQMSLELLGKVMVSFEEVLCAPSGVKDTAQLGVEIDRVYGELIVWKSNCVSELMSSAVHQRKGFADNSLSAIESEPYLAARRRIESLVAGRTDQTYSLGRWGESLVRVKRNDAHGQITNFQGLTAEASRVKVWANNRSIPTPANV